MLMGGVVSFVWTVGAPQRHRRYTHVSAHAHTLRQAHKQTHTVHQRRRLQMHVMFREEVTSEYAKKTLPQARDF